MSEKVILVLVDGMMQCGNPFAKELISKSAYTLNARTVLSSVTLPCHMSLFHCVDPDRHGILSNTYMPQVRSIDLPPVKEWEGKPIV
ncbi:MAG: alkaline phosphatase family protein [Clostridia bacterium]|nr:alkaline phosphatase family protein [Clostridia bacterium]